MKIKMNENQFRKIIFSELKKQQNINEGFGDVIKSLGSYIQKIINKFKGKNPSKEEIEKEIEIVKKDGLEYQKPSRDKIVGTDWDSCRRYKNKGGLSNFSKYLKIDKNSSRFQLTYEGPASGIDICHASGGSDTLHQAFNVLVCEINPYLYDNMLKPNIQKVEFEIYKKEKNYKLVITVPLEKAEKVFQLNRRGGWGHKDGKSTMENECKKNSDCEGPKTYTIRVPETSKDITEYFISYSI
jgi:hypothetical protein